MPRDQPDWLVDAPTAAAYVSHLRGRHCAPGTIWSWATRGHIHRLARGRYDIREIDTHTRRALMDELVDWLRTQLDNDEQVAQTAIAGQADPENGWGIDGRAITPHVGVVHEEAARQHIARWNPARVLAEIDARRRTLDEHQSYGGYGECCQTCHRHDDLAGDPWPCTTVRLIALPYAGRPGYLDAWRPDA